MYREEYDKGKKVDLSKELLSNNVTQIAVKYLKALPEGLLTRKLSPLFKLVLENKAFEPNAVTQNEDQELYKRLRFLSFQLPLAYRETLRLLVEHLKLVIDNRESNRMDINATRVCFGILLGPTISILITFLLSHFETLEYFLPRTQMFGYPLSVGSKMSKNGIPRPISDCLDWLDKEKRTKGLWVNDGKKNVIREIRIKFDSLLSFDIDEDEHVDNVAGVAKLYISLLGEHLFGDEELVKQFNGVSVLSPQVKVSKLQLLIERLPELNKITLERLCRSLHKHWKDFADSQEVTPFVLASSFGESYCGMKDLIENYPALFPKKEDQQEVKQKVEKDIEEKEEENEEKEKQIDFIEIEERKDLESLVKEETN